MSQITIRQLEIFRQIVERGSFRRCAEHIGVSQVAIGGHVKHLELAVGGMLFRRERGRPATLTPLGERTLKHADDVLRSIDSIVSLGLENRTAGEPATLVVSAHSYVVQRIQAAAAAAARHRGLTVTFDTTLYTRHDELMRLSDGSSDIVYGFGTPGVLVPGGTVVADQSLSLFVAEGHPLAASHAVAPSDVSRYPVVLLSSQNPLREIVRAAMEGIGIREPHAVLETDEWGLVLTTVARSDAFVFMFSDVPASIENSFGLRRVALSTPMPTVSIYRLLSERARASATVRSIVADFDEVLRRRPSDAPPGM